nr:hypothetical protein BaRGS_026941 [Batillaria attramentaria]
MTMIAFKSSSVVQSAVRNAGLISRVSHGVCVSVPPASHSVSVCASASQLRPRPGAAGGADKTKGHQNGHQKPTNGPKVDKKGSSAKPQDKSDQVGKRETTQAPPKGSSSKLWLTILLISAATAGVAILAMNESAQATVGDVYKKHLHTHVLQAAELLSIDVSSFRMWWDEADSNSKQDAPPAEHRQQQEVSQPPPSQSDKRSGDKAKESKMQNDQGEDSTPQKSTAQRAADSEQEREVAEGDKVSEKPVQKDQGEKSQPQKSTAQTAAEDSKQKQDTDEGDKAPEKPVVQDIRVKSTHKTEKDSTQERAGQEAKVGEEQTPDKPSPEPPSPPAPAESSGEKEDVGGDTKDIKPPKSGRESYAKSAITNDDDYKVRKKLDEADDLLELGQLDEALQKFDSIIRKHPTSPRAHAGKADVLDKLAEKKRSNQLLEESIKVYGQLLTFPDVPAELMKKSARRLADRQQFRGWGRQSVKTMQFLVDRFPDDVQLQRELGVNHLMVGQDKEAKQVFEKILKIHPDDGFAMVHLGFVYQTSDSNPQKAIPLLLVGINSNDPGTQDGRFYFQLGSALQREGRTEEGWLGLDSKELEPEYF